MNDHMIYADNAATTRVSDSVLEAMLPYLKENYGNPSSIYRIANISARAIIRAREQVAAALGCDPAEVLFTSCGTESDNWALKGALRKLRARGKNHLITTNFEHHAVLHTAKHLEKEGFEVTYLPVDDEGFIRPEDVRAAIRPDTALVSVMYANNEIGTIQPVAAIGAVCREAGVWFHTDAVQAVGNVRIDVKEQNIDLLSLSGHKIHAPKGVGALYVRRGIVLDTFMDGGGQENGKRAGTENVAGIVALGAAMEEIYADFDEHVARETKLRDYVIGEALKIDRTRLNGPRENRLPGNVNISFEGIEGEALLLRLNDAGIEASSGSACTSGSLDPSHVLLAIGLPHETAHGSLRLSFGRYNTEKDARYICEQLPGIVRTLREMSPVWERMQNDSTK